jgi:hypothetical protein
MPIAPHSGDGLHLVLDHDGLSPIGLEPVSEDTGEDVINASTREGKMNFTVRVGNGV